MGKLLSGHYGSPPEAESIPITLKECSQKLNMKPSDFVSSGPPKFFEEAFGASGRYLLFLVDADEVLDSAIWKCGYYLLPLEAKDVLVALSKHKGRISFDPRVMPVEWEEETDAPEPIKERALKWSRESQPLFFKCGCKSLQLRLQAPWALRRRWKARLRCPGRCQPPLVKLL
jgi:hypothetical protein